MWQKNYKNAAFTNLPESRRDIASCIDKYKLSILINANQDFQSPIPCQE